MGLFIKALIGSVQTLGLFIKALIGSVQTLGLFIQPFVHSAELFSSFRFEILQVSAQFLHLTGQGQKILG